MANILDKEEVKQPTSGEKALGFLLTQVHKWQRKAAKSPEEIKESILALQQAIQEKTGREAHVPKMELEELFAFITNPAHFNKNERNLITSLFKEVLRLRRRMDKNGKGPVKEKKPKPSFV